MKRGTKKQKPDYTFKNDQWITNISVMLDSATPQTKGQAPDVRVKALIDQLEKARRELIQMVVDRATLRRENNRLLFGGGDGTRYVDARTARFVRQIFWAGGVSAEEISRELKIAVKDVKEIACGLKVDTC